MHISHPTRPSQSFIHARRWLLVVAMLVVCIGGRGALHTYHRYNRFVDRKLTHSPIYMAALTRQGRTHRTRSNRALPVNLSASLRNSQRVPGFSDLPPQLVQAVIAIEDRRFFEHGGIDYKRTAGCALEDMLSFRVTCGGSTLTQQVARTSFLSSQRTLHRKVAELFIAKRLEARLNKQQIFAMYAAEIDLGQNGQVAVHGFRQGAAVYFRQDPGSLDLAQCALLAGIIHAPNFDNPYRHPERALHRRNVVLDAMVTTGAITRSQADAAKAEPLHLASSEDEVDPAFERSFPG